MEEKKIIDEEEMIYSDEEKEYINEIPKEERYIHTQPYDKSVSDLVSMMRDGDIILDPEYQRNYIWDNKKASLLIESILLSVPIPVIYVSEEEEGHWSVIDGLQINCFYFFFLDFGSRPPPVGSSEMTFQHDNDRASKDVALKM